MQYFCAEEPSMGRDFIVAPTKRQLTRVQKWFAALDPLCGTLQGVNASRRLLNNTIAPWCAVAGGLQCSDSKGSPRAPV